MIAPRTAHKVSSEIAASRSCHRVPRLQQGVEARFPLEPSITRFSCSVVLGSRSGPFLFHSESRCKTHATILMPLVWRFFSGGGSWSSVLLMSRVRRYFRGLSRAAHPLPRSGALLASVALPPGDMLHTSCPLGAWPTFFLRLPLPLER